jgi:hypothetical protein
MANLGRGPHRHDDVDVVVLADAADDARSERTTELEGGLICAECAEDVDEIARVEGNRRRRALDGGVDGIGVVTHVRRMGGDRDARAVAVLTTQLDLHDVRAVTREDARPPRARQERLAIDDCARAVGSRDDRLVVRELSLDQPADEIDPLHVEQDLALVRRHGDLDRCFGVGQDSHQLGVGSTRHHDHDFRRYRAIELHGPHRDPIVVGGGERHRVPVEPGQHAGQDRPALVRRGGEDDLAERLAQDAGVDGGGGRLTDGGNHRELVRLDALDARAVVATGQLQGAVLRRQHELDALVRQRGHQVGEQLGRHGDLALFGDLARDPAVDPDLQVRRRQLEAGVLRLEQHVRQHRQRGAAAHRAAHRLETTSQVLLHHRDIHADLISIIHGSKGYPRIRSNSSIGSS